MPRVGGGQDILMRKDGYVTAAEVAEATGQDLTTVHRKIRERKMLGGRVGWGWYVAIHALRDSGEYPENGTIWKQLNKLAQSVGKKASGELPLAATTKKPEKTVKR